jgi:hypothetical protein
VLDRHRIRAADWLGSGWQRTTELLIEQDLARHSFAFKIGTSAAFDQVETNMCNQSSDDKFANQFEAWKYFAEVGGADKDRMITIATLLLGLSAGIVSFTFTTAFKANEIVEPQAAIFMALAGLVVSFASSLLTLTYGGYASWNWAKADQIARDQKWTRLYPDDSPFSPKDIRERWFLTRFALSQGEPKLPPTRLAPIFWCFFWLSLFAFGMHLSILLWSVDVRLHTPASSNRPGVCRLEGHPNGFDGMVALLSLPMKGYRLPRRCERCRAPKRKRNARWATGKNAAA